MSKILITGGAGFVGSSLAILFKQANPTCKIICLDNLNRRGSELNIPRLRHAGIDFVHGDLRNKEDLNQIGAVDWLIECAAEPSVHAGAQDPNYLINSNFNGLLNCLEHLRINGGKLIFLSSSRVYPIAGLRNIPLKPHNNRLEIDTKQQLALGVSEQGISEQFSISGARSLYGVTKYAGELFIEEYAASYDLQAVVNRCGVLAGPWQMGKVDQGFFALWTARHLFSGCLSYMGFGGEGLQVRDVLHVRDLFNLLQIQMQNFSSHIGKVYNVGGGKANSVSLRELTDLVVEITANKIPITADAATREADIPYYVTDNSQVMAATNWQPQVSIPELAQEVVDWLTKNQILLKPIFQV